MFFITSHLIYSQNIQIHYDFGKDRNYITTTFEMFKPDEWGSTFWFIDLDFNNEKNKSISLSYIELARYFKISGFDLFQPSLQYNDGVAPWGRLGPAWLIGIHRTFDFIYFRINADVLFRSDYLSDGKDIQFTLTWFEPFFDRFLFTGFFDVWSFGENTKYFILLTEPQIWMKIWRNFSIGTEIEISNNFIGKNLFRVCPTIALKWNF